MISAWWLFAIVPASMGVGYVVLFYVFDTLDRMTGYNDDAS